MKLYNLGNSVYRPFMTCTHHSLPDFFLKSLFRNFSFSNDIMANSLDQDQAAHYVRPDLVPN